MKFSRPTMCQILFMVLSNTLVAMLGLEPRSSDTASSVSPLYHNLEMYPCGPQQLNTSDFIHFNWMCVVVILSIWKMENYILEDLSIPISSWDLDEMLSPLWNLSWLSKLLKVLSLYPNEMFLSLLSCSSQQFVTLLESFHLDIELHAGRDQVFSMCGYEPPHTMCST